MSDVLLSLQKIVDRKIALALIHNDGEAYPVFVARLLIGLHRPLIIEGKLDLDQAYDLIQARLRFALLKLQRHGDIVRKA